MNAVILGFTGNQQGATSQQKERFVRLISAWTPKEFHVGDCIGADHDAYVIVRNISEGTTLVGHPPDVYGKRAFCSYDVQHDPLPYLTRNKRIVDSVETMVAMPGGFSEEVRSGTWSTVRYARKCNVPVYIIYPDGSISRA